MPSRSATVRRRVSRWLCIASLVVVGSGSMSGRAADHLDGPATTADAAIDLGDLYVWRTDAGSLIVVLTFAPGLDPGAPPVTDPDVLYSIHFDTNRDDVEDWSIRTRFGEHEATGDPGVQIRYLPGSGSDLVGPLDTTLQGNGIARAWVGLADDPFFADLDGLAMSVQNQTLSFDPQADGFAGLNAMAIVLEMDPELLLQGSEPMQIWATAGRAP